MNSAIVLILSISAGQLDAGADQIIADFGNKPLEALDLGKIGPWKKAVRQEADGLHIVLPEGKKYGNTVGVRSRLYMHGDFEVTLSYKLLESKPKGGYGAGVMLWLMLNDSPTSSFAAIARRSHPSKGELYATDRGDSPKKDGTLAHQVKFFPTKSMEGELRLVREGDRLRYFVSVAGVDNFHLIRDEKGFGKSAVYHTKFGADLGNSKGKLSVILRELRIRATKLSPHLTESPAEETPSISPSVIVVCMLGFGVLLFGGIALWRRRKAEIDKPKVKRRR